MSEWQPPPLGRLFRRRAVYRHLILPTTSTTPARRGRRTYPACGSCRRPRKSVSAKGERDREERDKGNEEEEEELGELYALVNIRTAPARFEKLRIEPPGHTGGR